MKIGSVALFVLILAFSQDGLGQDTNCNDSVRFKLDSHSREATSKLALARDFLWQQWRSKKCGEVSLTSWSREGARTDSNYKIEVLQPNTVVLTVAMHTYDDASAPVDGFAVPASGYIPRVTPESRSYRVYTIERVQLDVPFIVEKAKSIPDSKQVPPSNYHLRFRGKDGRVITDF
jgi:hypothetical protein